MTLAYGCVLVAAFLPLVCAVYAKMSKPGYSNKRPREFLASLEGKGQRANWAQQNSFEAFPFFAAGVIIAHLAYAQQPVIDRLAIGFILFRILYIFFYITDRSTLRSLAWAVAFFCSVAMFFIGA